MVQVTIFNTNTLGVTVQVNNGQQFQIAGAAPSGAPQVPAYGGPTWSNTTSAPNVLAPGLNTLVLTPAGALDPFVTTLSLPGQIQWTSVQVYLFFNSYSDVSWTVLNQGQYVTGSLSLRQARLDKDAPVQTA
jgi:hypothetical protein